MKEVQSIYERLQNNQTNIASNPGGQTVSNKEDEEEGRQNPSRKGRFTSIPKIDTQDSRLRQTRTFKESNEFRKRKMSSGQFDLGSSTELPRFN